MKTAPIKTSSRTGTARGELRRTETPVAVKLPDPAKLVKVHFEYFDPAAKSVFIAGGFNEWHPAATEMVHLGSGRWAKEILLGPGTYEYRLVVDGVWKQDPGCPLSTPNPFGDRNSLRVVEVERRK